MKMIRPAVPFRHCVASVLLLVAMLPMQSTYAAIYTYEFFYGQNVLGEPIVDSFYANLSDNGNAIGFVSLPSQPQLTSIYHPTTGHNLLGVSESSFWAVYNSYQINDAGSVAWTGYDPDFNPIPFLASGGTITNPDLGEGAYYFQDINNNEEVLGFYIEPSESGMFIYKNSLVTKIPDPVGVFRNPMSISDDGQILFSSFDADYNFLGNWLHRYGTNDFTLLQLDPEVSGYAFYDARLEIAPSGLVSAVIDGYDADFNLIDKKLIFLASDGTVRESIGIPMELYAVRTNGIGEAIAANQDGAIVKWNGSTWSPVQNKRLPSGVTLTPFDYNIRGDIIGLANGVPGTPGFLSVAFYATSVPEPGSVLTLSGLLLGFGLRTARHRSKKHATGA